MDDLHQREADFAAARKGAAEAGPVVNELARLADLAMLELLAKEAAARYRQLATASWELARARAALDALDGT